MILNGIDVSKWQGVIDWSKVSAASINVAIIRSGYGKVLSQKDPYFDANYSGAKGAFIPIGTYWYSYATSVDEAAKEAEVCIAVLNGKSFEYPVYYDIEESSQAAFGKTFCTNMAKTFCEKIKAAGYVPGVYANKNFFTNYLDKAALESAGYSLWIAHYGTSIDYSDSYDMHQYSSTGRVNGISGNVDLNYVFKEYCGSSSSQSEETVSASTTTANSTRKTIIKDHQQWYNVLYSSSTGFKITVDGIVGANSKKAFIMAYQYELNKQFKAGLSVDGIWGTKTYNASVSVKKGARGMITHILQCLLYFNKYELAIDEIFGSATETVVKQFQSDSCLSVDGIAGKNTFKSLFSKLV